jgi:hypothetical protein
MSGVFPNIGALEQELVDIAKSLPAFKEGGFSVFNLSDMTEKVSKQGNTSDLPMFGVAYDGMAPAQVEKNENRSTAQGNASAVMLDIQFVIVIAVAYQYTGQGDEKPNAYTLLGELRNAIFGYRGANLRAWRFAGERPEMESSSDGIIFYTQVWRTTAPLLSKQ